MNIMQEKRHVKALSKYWNVHERRIGIHWCPEDTSNGEGEGVVYRMDGIFDFSFRFTCNAATGDYKVF